MPRQQRDGVAGGAGGVINFEQGKAPAEHPDLERNVRGGVGVPGEIGDPADGEGVEGSGILRRSADGHGLFIRAERGGAQRDGSVVAVHQSVVGHSCGRGGVHAFVERDADAVEVPSAAHPGDQRSGRVGDDRERGRAARRGPAQHLGDDAIQVAVVRQSLIGRGVSRHSRGRDGAERAAGAALPEVGDAAAAGVGRHDGEGGRVVFFHRGVCRLLGEADVERAGRIHGHGQILRTDG